jgi:homogentisate 1,2-dioxygenase
MKEQCDPTIYCVLTSKSKIPGISLSEFCVFSPKWITATNTFRPPYYHRTMATEMLGMIYGEYKGSVRELGPGHLSCENSYMPHGESYESWRLHTTRELKNELVGEDTLQFMMHMSSQFSLTEFARKTHKNIKDQKSGEFWEDIKPHFLDHLEEVNRNLASVGRPVLEVKTKEEKTGSVSSEEWQAVEEKGPTPPTL